MWTEAFRDHVTDRLDGRGDLGGDKDKMHGTKSGSQKNPPDAFF